MQKSGVMELRKLYKKKGDCSIKHIAYGYINASGEVLCMKRERFLSMNDEVQFKYLDIIRKGMAGSIGKNIETIDMGDGDHKKALLSMIDSDLGNSEILSGFYQQIAEHYPECENILVILITNTYDIPMRGQDGMKNVEASDEVYDFLQGIICPVALEEPGLSYSEENNEFEKKTTRWVAKAPMGSFLYPSFEDRSADTDKISIFSRKADDSFLDFMSSVFEITCQTGYAKRQETLQKVISTAIESQENKINAYMAIRDRMDGDDKDITGQDMESILKDAGANEKDIKAALGVFERSLGTDKAGICADTAKKKDICVKNSDIAVKVKGDLAGRVSSKQIDGKRCLVIDMGFDDSVEVNGIPFQI